MCIASLSDYDAETARQICELEALLMERRRKQLERDPAMRARANSFMPAVAVDASPCAEAVAAGSYQERAA